MNRTLLPVRVLVIPALLLAACADAGDDDVAVVESPDAVVAPTDPAAATAAAFVDPNVANLEELLTVPGINEAVADELIAARPFDDMLRVDSVLRPRLDEMQRDSAYARMWIPIDLNNASSEEIMLIPGVGDRMTHEFEEYRPYRAIEEFRREIGKYVDAAEVARLERYVVVR